MSRRLRQLPELNFPEELPISAYREEIATAIAENQVVVVCGETGSGKTTQLPKICLSLGRGVAGMIGHTQPRRIAARSVAARIATELKTELGRYVGFKVRFSDRVGADSYVKLMTDGILLAETRGDRNLRSYDTIIIDEAHERSLNIDFLLGYLKRLLPRRPDLKLIITSATIDPERFSRHFADAPMLEVPGRTYPVEVRYHPLQGEEENDLERDQIQGILDGVDELARQGPGDVLVFLPGEREIRETAEALRKHHPMASEILPLYARLSVKEQQRVFRPTGRRRVVLATNVAETSLTVPGIRYVVDTGYARISRYSYRNKVQQLPIEKISRASADQRKGRCGRLGPGVCIRLYGQEEYESRPEFTEPEILRTNLAAVILQMASLKLGDVAGFPFVDPPHQRYISDGYRLLTELGAVEGERRLTPIGRELVKFPLDPRLGRMLLAAKTENCLREVLIIVSAIAVQDPRERPLEAREKADQAHARFQDPRSDFLTLLKLWDFYHEQARHLSRNKLRKLCRESFLSNVRMREWHDIQRQLLAILHNQGIRTDRGPAEPDAIHRALLTGLLGHIGVKDDKGEYLGARGIRFRIHPGSGMSKGAPKWIMAAELVETTRLYARIVAGIEPAWAERLAGYLVRRSYSEPHWEKKRAQVAATERVTLYGLPLVTGRKVNYGPIDPKPSREILIRAALVQGEYRTDAKFFSHNLALITEVEGLEHKSRRQDILVDEELLYQFYAERIPEGIYSGPRLEKWYRQEEKKDPGRLLISRDYLMRHGAEGITAEMFPDTLAEGEASLALRYRFEPGNEADGVTVKVPLALLNSLDPQRGEWLVPGLLEEKLVHMLRSLPKSLRRNFVPIPDFVRASLAALPFGQGSLPENFARHLLRMTGAKITPDVWRLNRLPEHLRMRYEVFDDRGTTVAVGRDLDGLRREMQESIRSVFQSRPTIGFERDAVTSWDFGDLPESMDFTQAGTKLRGYPALCAEAGGTVSLRLLDTPARAAESHRQGLVRLFMLEFAPQIRSLEKRLPGIRRLALLYAQVSNGGAELRQELILATVERAMFGDDAPPRTGEEYGRCCRRGRERLVSTGDEICALVEKILSQRQELVVALGKKGAGNGGGPKAEMIAQLDDLIYRGFVLRTPYAWLRHYPRYLTAIARRLERLRHNPGQDARMAAQFTPLWQAWHELAESRVDHDERSPELNEYRWLLEELRVSLFAQELKTSVPVSVKRLKKRWDRLQAGTA
ncbi:MAG: ATP-dependent RNA helicase HrpA [Gammaproteobacteria bacterium]|nr:ATP-dependent RNA helicase HrpA [Gammaproteobacteria bacterium]